MLNLKITKKNVIWLSTIICGLFIITFILFHIVSSMDGEKYLKVVDVNGNEINEMLVIPLYMKTLGIGIGPDGKGPHTPTKLTITKPFVFNSGDELMSKKIPSRGILLTPFGKTSPLFAGIFHSNDVYMWLFVKKNFTPKYLSRENIYAEPLIIMSKSNINENAALIDMLLASRVDQNILKKEFKIDWTKDRITVDFDDKDIALLNSYK